MTSMYEIELANARAGYYFFEPGTLRFFRSRIGETVYEGPGGIYFVTSEQFEDSRGRRAPRGYTVRQFFADTGQIETVGPFNAWTRAEANTRARWAAAGNLEWTVKEEAEQ